MGLLTGSAFPQGGAIINSHLPCRKKLKALQNAHLLRCAANRTARRMKNTPRGSVFARLASKHF